MPSFNPPHVQYSSHVNRAAESLFVKLDSLRIQTLERCRNPGSTGKATNRTGGDLLDADQARVLILTETFMYACVCTISTPRTQTPYREDLGKSKFCITCRNGTIMIYDIVSCTITIALFTSIEIKRRATVKFLEASQLAPPSAS